MRCGETGDRLLPSFPRLPSLPFFYLVLTCLVASLPHSSLLSFSYVILLALFLLPLPSLSFFNLPVCLTTSHYRFLSPSLYYVICLSTSLHPLFFHISSILSLYLNLFTLSPSLHLFFRSILPFFHNSILMFVSHSFLFASPPS